MQQLCSRNCGRPANPGRKWCQTCYQQSQPQGSQGYQPHSQFQGSTSQHSAPLCVKGCGRTANPGYQLCQQCFQMSQGLYSGASAQIQGSQQGSNNSGQFVCPNNHTRPANSSNGFCGQCGLQFSPQTYAAQYVCSKNKSHIRPANVFDQYCGICGGPYVPANSTPTAQYVCPQNHVRSPNDQNNFCKLCGGKFHQSKSQNKKQPSGPLCSNCNKRAANPGRKWCEKCFQNQNGPQSSVPSNFQAQSVLCSKNCGNYANAGYPWCQQCFQAQKGGSQSGSSQSGSSGFSSLGHAAKQVVHQAAQGFQAGYNQNPQSYSAAVSNGGRQGSHSKPIAPQPFIQDTSSCLICSVPQPDPTTGFCKKCWRHTYADYTSLCNFYQCTEPRENPMNQFCTKHSNAYSRDKTPRPILFYEKGQAFYEFTNFFPSILKIENEDWPTSEHFFQAMKFRHLTIHKCIAHCGSDEVASIQNEWTGAQRRGYNDTRGQSWPSQLYQDIASKFSPSTRVSEVVRLLPTPRHAFEFARKWNRFADDNWKEIKFSVMHYALRIKFQDPNLKKLLISTNRESLVEHTHNDKCWADGGDGSGENWLGKLLMLVRKEIFFNLEEERKQQKEKVDYQNPKGSPRENEKMNQGNSGLNQNSRMNQQMYDFSNGISPADFAKLNQGNNDPNQTLKLSQGSYNNSNSKMSPREYERMNQDAKRNQNNSPYQSQDHIPTPNSRMNQSNGPSQTTSPHQSQDYIPPNPRMNQSNGPSSQNANWAQLDIQKESKKHSSRTYQDEQVVSHKVPVIQIDQKDVAPVIFKSTSLSESSGSRRRGNNTMDIETNY